MENRLGNQVFSAIPEYRRRRIFGSEQEYHSSFEKWGNLSEIGIKQNNDEKDELPNYFMENGGRFYKDCGHVEGCTPEVNNPLELVIYEEASKRTAKKMAGKIFYSNIGFSESLNNVPVSFGAHENYFTTADIGELKKLIPFLITRQIFAGSGSWRDGDYLISQRAHFIERLIGINTLFRRGIINTRDQPLSTNEGWHRFHLIIGEGNMCQEAAFVKIASTSMMIDLLEDGKFPDIEYSNNLARNDLHIIAEQHEKWKMLGAKGKNAIDIQKMYLNVAGSQYWGRDETTDDALVRWSNILHWLEKDPSALVGSVDWVTKKSLIDCYSKREPLEGDPTIESIDLEYHNIDESEGLFYYMSSLGKVKKVVTDELVERAITNPPRTRAFLRGGIVNMLTNPAKKEGIDALFYDDWMTIEIKANGKNVEAFRLEDPFKTYEEFAPIARKVIMG